MTALRNGDYVVRSPLWDNGGTVDVGAVTWGSGTTGVKGTINRQNSALGAVASASLVEIEVDDVNNTFLARFLSELGGSIRVGSQFNGFLPTPRVFDFGSARTYVEDAAALLISTTAKVTDVDSPDFQGGQLHVSLTAGGQASDRLRIRNVGTGTGQINVQGSQVRFGSIVIGTFAGGVGTGSLIVSLTNQANPFRVQTLLRNITFSNISDNPSTVSRTVRVTVSDGESGISNPVFKQINVTAVNDAPILDTSGNPTLDTIEEDATDPDGTRVSSLLAGAVTDPDGSTLRGIAVTAASNFHGVWQFRLNINSDWLPVGDVSDSSARLLPGFSRLRFIPKADFNGIVKIYYRAWDQTQGEAGGTFNVIGNTGGTGAFSTAKENASLTVTPVNDAPVISLGGTIGYVADSSPITLAAFAVVSDIDSPNFAGGRRRDAGRRERDRSGEGQ